MAGVLDRRTQKWKQLVHEKTGEDVELIYAGSRIGAWSALAQTELFKGIATASDSSIAPWMSAKSAAIHRGGGKDTKLPTSFLIAVTAANVHFFKMGGILWFQWLSKDLGVFQRASLEVFATDKTVTRRFGFVDREHEQGVAFEGFRRHHLTDEFTELIGARMADSAADLPST